MIEKLSSVRRVSRLAVIACLATIVLNVSAASAQTPPSLGSASTFALLAGAAVTCTNTAVTGDVGVWPGTVVAQTLCTVAGTVHAADAVAKQAFMDFTSAYDSLLNHPPACTPTATATLAETLLPGVYCVDATAKTGPLMLDSGGNKDAVWIFLVNGALTGTGFNVTMINGGQPCNVFWWASGAATLTTSNFLGTILAGAAITVTGGTFNGHALATAAATLTSTALSVCSSTTVTPPPHMGKCEDHDDDRDHDGDHDDKDHDDKDHHKSRKDHDSKDHDDRDHDSKDHDSKDHDSSGHDGEDK
jgi:hypothetical protein